MAGEPQDPLLGAVLDSRYRVLESIGRGGMGHVYLAEETRLRRRSAVKVLHPHLAADRAHVERFLREAQAIAQLEHPNIVDIFAYGEEPDGVAFFAMELLQGEDLDARIKASAERPYTNHEACVWALQIARAVGAVHDAGLIHRDLKVSNIFLARRRDGEEVVKLLDFGIARSEDGSELTATGIALGTPGYMSPEQIENRSIDRRTDIYSFGVLLFKLITGQLPFRGEPIQIAIQHRDVPPPRPSQIAPDAAISPALERLILTAMAKDPGHRFQTMHEVADGLVALLTDEAPDLLVGVARPARPSTRPGTAPEYSITRKQVQGAAGQKFAAVVEATPAPNPSQTGPTAAMVASPVSASWVVRSRQFLVTAGLLTCAALLAVILVNGSTEPTHALTPAPTIPQSVESAALDAPTEPPPARAPSAPTTPPQTSPLPEQPASAATPNETGAPPAEVTPAAQPPANPTPGKVPTPVKKPADVFKQIAADAKKCRRSHGLLGGPKIKITYWVNNDGAAQEVTSATGDELGKCLASAVVNGKFNRVLALDQELSL